MVGGGDGESSARGSYIHVAADSRRLRSVVLWNGEMGHFRINHRPNRHLARRQEISDQTVRKPPFNSSRSHFHRAHDGEDPNSSCQDSQASLTFPCHSVSHTTSSFPLSRPVNQAHHTPSQRSHPLGGHPIHKMKNNTLPTPVLQRRSSIVALLTIKSCALS